MKKWKGKIQIFVIAIAIASIAFVALLWVERQSLKDLERKSVVRCIRTCPAGEEITTLNVQEYFELTSIAATLATEQTFDNLEILIGSYPDRTIESGEIVYAPVLKVEDMADGIHNPVEISVTAAIDYAVAGRIRKGDTVNVYVENPDTESFELILEQVVVQNAYDANATVIGMSNEYALASMFTFCVEASVADELDQLYNGTVAILKIR